MGKIITVLNHKGGVGKTTASNNLATAFVIDKSILTRMKYLRQEYLTQRNREYGHEGILKA